MLPTKNDIITQLQRDILPLQGFKPPPSGTVVDVGLGPVAGAFPNGSFPIGAVHEVLSAVPEQTAAAVGFITGLLSRLIHGDSVCIWISTCRTLFPPALKTFGIDPDKVIFIDLHREKDALWAMEEALKCEGLAAVVGEIQDISLTASRRLQLAVEQSRVTGFLLRRPQRSLNTIACVARWVISPLPSELDEGLPGVGFSRWKVQLMKIRNGRPGIWPIEWAGSAFRLISQRGPSAEERGQSDLEQIMAGRRKQARQTG